MGDGTHLNRAAYERVIAENVEWLRKQPRSLERDHIETVLYWSIKSLYGTPTVAETDVVLSRVVHPDSLPSLMRSDNRARRAMAVALRFRRKRDALYRMVLDLRDRLLGRSKSVIRTSVSHSDSGVAEEMYHRGLAYENAVEDLDRLLGDAHK